MSTISRSLPTLLLTLLLASCGSGAFQIDRYFEDYSFGKSLADLRADPERFKKTDTGFSINGESEYLGLTVDQAFVKSNDAGGFRDLIVTLMPDVSHERVLKKLTDKLGTPTLTGDDKARWDKGSYYVTYIGTDPNEGPTIVSRYLEKPYKPYDPTFTWGERLESVRAKVGSLEETETAGIYESSGDLYSFDARVVYRFENDRLVSITYMPKTKQAGGFFTSPYDITEEEGRELSDRLEETYGGYDDESIEQGRLSGSAIWHFATTTISMSAEGHIFSGRFTLLISFRQAEL